MASLASITFTSPDAAGSRVTLSNSTDTQEKTRVEIPVSVSGNTSPLNQVVKVSINSPDNAEKMLPLFLPTQTSTSISTTVQSRSVPIPLSCSNTYKKSCWLRPCKITSFIRCGFEEAALRYAAKQRWVALFPDTSKASEPAPTTLSDLTKPYMEGRWTNDKVRGGYKKRPMQPVTPIVHHAPLPHQHPAPKPPAPAPHLDHVASRWCEEGDSVVNRIQEMRSQFVPPPTRLSSQTPTPAPPRFSCYASTFAPPPTAMLPYQIRQQYARGPPVSIPTQEHGGTRPLFRGAQNQDTCMPQQEKEEEDEWVDIEDVSPPHMTYHLYRMSADGSSLTLPITVTPSHIHESGNTALHINPGTDSHQSFQSAPNLNQHGPLSTVSNHNASLTVLQHQQQVEMPQKHNISHTKPGYKLHFTNIPQSSIHTKVAASGVVSSIPWDQRKKDTVGKDQDNDVVVVSSSSKDIVVISSDSSPEVDTQENSPQQTSTKTQKSSYKSTKDTDKASNSVLCRVKLLEKTTPAELKTTYENDELPDLDGHTWPTPCKSNTQLQSNFNSCPVVEIKDVNDVANLSGASTIIFEDIEEKNVASDETPNPNSPMNSVSSVILPDLNKPVSSNIRLELHSGSGSHLEFPDFKLLDTSSDEAPSTPKCDNENIKNTVLPQKKQSFRQEGTIVRPLLGEVLEIKENLDTKGLNSPKQTSVPDATVECSRSENKTNVGNKNHADDESKDSGVIVELEVISEGSNLIKNLDSEVNQNEERDPVVLTQSIETITSVINEGVIVKKAGELDFLEYNKSENFNINSSLCKDGIFNLCSVAGKVPEKIGSDFGTVTENEVRKVHSQPLPSIQKSIPPIDGCSKTLPEQQSDYCEFVDTSRIIFVSDGKLVVAVHVTQNSQDASAHSPDTEAASISHSPLFSQDSHSSELSESDSITSRDKNTTENKEEEVTELRVMLSEELPKKRDEVVPGKHSEINNQGNTSCEEHECLNLDTARLEIDIDKTGMIKSNLYECMSGKDQADCASDDFLMIYIDQNGKVDIIQASPTLPAAHPVSHTSGLDCQTDILMSDTKEAHNVGYQNVEERNTINEDIPSAKQESAKTLQLSEITEEGTEDGTNLKISPNILMQHHVMIPEFTNETSRPGWLQKNDWIMHELRQEFRIMGERKMKMIDETGSCTKVKNVDIHEPVFEKTEESDYLAAAGDLKDRNMQVPTNESTSFPSCNDNVNKMSKESDGTNEALEKEFIKTSSSVTVYEKQVKVMTAIGKSQVRQDNTVKEMEYGFVSRSDDNIRGMSSLDCIDSQSTNKEKCLSGAQESSQMHLTSTVCPLTDSEPCSNIDEHQEQEITQQNSCTIIPKKYNKNDLEIVSCAEKQTMTQGSLKENINIKKQAKYSINEDQIEQKEVAYFKNDTLIASDKENISRYMTEDQTQALQNYTSIPLSSMKVIGSHSDVKQSSFPTQSLPVSKFVSRLSKKIEELAPSLKPHITTPARTSKCPRDFSTTLNDFIAKHRMAEEKDGARIGSDVSLLSTAPLDQGTRTELGSNIQAPSHTAFKVLSPIQPTESTLSFTRSIQFHSSVLSENLQPSAILQLTDKVASLPSASPPASVQLACTTLTSTCIQSPTVIQARDNVKSSQWDNTQASNELACNTQPLTSSSEQVIFQSPLKFLIVTPPEPSPITQPSTTTPSISFSMSPITASSLVSSVDMAAASTDQSPITQVLCRSEEILGNQTLGVHSDQTDHTITQQPFIASTQSSIIVQSPLSTQPSVICKPSPVCTQPAVSAQQSDINQSPISTQSSVNNQPSVSIQSPVNTQPSIIVQSQVNAQPSVCTQLSLIVQSPVNTQPSIGPQLPVTTQSPSSSNISSPVSDTPILDVEVVEDCDGRKTEGNASYRESLMDIRTETSYKEDTNIINRGEDVSGKEGSMKKQTGSNEEYDLCDSESDTSGLEDVLCEERDVLEKEGDIKRRRDVSKMQHDTKRRRMNMLYEDREEAEKENYNQRREDVSNKENELLSKEGDIERKDVSYKEKDVSDMENDKKRRIYVSCNEQSVSDKGNGSKEKDVSTEKNEREKREDVSDKDNEGKGESVVSSSRKRRRSHSPNHRLLQLSLPGTYIELVNLVSGGGEALVGVLKERGVIGPNTTFTSLKPDHTRSLLAQMIRTLHSVGDSDQLYVKLLRLHGLVKALDLLQHHGLECAIHCLTQYQTTHCVLLGGKLAS
ncbi:hypothetical protein Pmani_031566 [Petrolisthes manimaculis]|uniref:Uncharacterized protein n=1 Tax=Petrolisthes manimaculis TaxID=1843537 RepID=A0AAE1TUP7_9EUCA|nr:hypothetical protein Pmani_031566 [Petrolisthes manimaculis]